ncbi:S8 family peptidase [Nonomuraea sp. SBT364]|uniref:S8 family peptidase n=1 Tax=Nonomuraea sp. SBT364 TaxID=1580530 RepID=UPI00066B3A3A|nr:S8 family serine peptidase [Nonomuraea sp. SBT364]
MRRIASGFAALATVTALAACSPQGAAGTAATEYLVFYAEGRQADALARIGEAGGTAVLKEPKLGYVIARAAGRSFAETVGADPAVAGVSADRRIGHAPSAATVRGPATGPAAGAFPDASAFTESSDGDPLSPRQWDMMMIGADRAHAKAPGSDKVLVGVIDTGIDGGHPDIAANFNRELSRNFVTDKPEDENGETLDGPCEADGCKDPVDRDDDGHGTHVASTIASPANGIGVIGVAPRVQLVNIRAGQDSGFFFLKPSLDALTYAGDIGVDVVNMSYYVDPWLFNCRDHPSDSEKERLEQRAIITGMQRALDYARGKGVTLISALGNGSTDLGRPAADKVSPGYPRGEERQRKVDNSCLNVPAESDGVISVSALGPSGRKAIYSDYGVEQTDVAAPGGDTLDGKDSSATRSILAAAPEEVLRAKGRIDRDGKPRGTDVVRDCTRRPCSYYQYLDGTSMAAPHATGVAAILISRFGKPGPGGVTLAPDTVERYLFETATDQPCPTPRAYVYKVYGESTTHLCEGGADHNGFYGRGIVNAYGAATFQP